MIVIWVASEKMALFKFFLEKSLPHLALIRIKMQGEWLKIGLKMNKIAIFF